MAVLIVSHDIPLSIKYGNKILHLQNRQIFFGDAAAYENSAIGKKFLGTQQ
jgi:zinc transport system ATP-binding protein